MNRLGQARLTLFNMLKPLLPDGRVSLMVPASVVAPCIWIESARVANNAVGTAGNVMVATFPVVCVVDGSQDAETMGTDDLTAMAWDAIERVAGGAAQDAEPTTLDVGGPNLRAVTVNAAITIRGRGLCLPDNEVMP